MFQWLPPHVWRNLQSWSSSRLIRPCMIWLQLCDTPLFPAHRPPLLCSGILASMFCTTSQTQSCSDPEFFSSGKSHSVLPSLGSCSNAVSLCLRNSPTLFPPRFWFFLDYFTFQSERSSQLTLQHIFPVGLLFIFHCRMKLLRGRDFVHCADPAPVRVLAQGRH